jgi:hypothetical protein
MDKRFRRATAPVSATPIGTLTETRACSVLFLLVAILESTDKAVDLVSQAHVHRAPQNARPAHLTAAARSVSRIGLVGRRVQLVQQATTYQEATVLVARTPVVKEHTARVVIALAVPRTTRVPHAPTTAMNVQATLRASVQSGIV